LRILIRAAVLKSSAQLKSTGGLQVIAFISDGASGT